jgi:uncharacterized protein (DUF849 family)
LTTLTIEQRGVALNDKRTEVASLNMGSVNFGEVGFEDSIFWAPDQAVRHNVELVQKLAEFVRLIGHAVATPAEARAILGIRRI